MLYFILSITIKQYNQSSHELSFQIMTSVSWVGNISFTNLKRENNMSYISNTYKISELCIHLKNNKEYILL